ncbi:MAG: UDP-N-acetylglucosamine 2-epimerase (non-hydrolyzing) [Candidatus Babeliaceae bacterium]
MGPILIVIGTRPEGIKMIPVYYALKRSGINTLLCSTSQHDQLLTDVFGVFDIKPDFELRIMKPNQDLFYITQAVLMGMKEVFEQVHPSLVLVQGDTTTAMAAALAAFYQKLPIGHIEAGLRTNDLYSPFPEEMNRRFITLVSSYHFAPTAAAAANVLSYGVHRDLVFCTGNTVVDALLYIQAKIKRQEIGISRLVQMHVERAAQKKYTLLLVTMHRRESFDGGIERVMMTLKAAVERFEKLMIIYPCHPNPHIKQMLEKVAINHERFIVCDPLPYADLVYLYSRAHTIMTDSGGIQEEATSLGKPVIVLREKTERLEGIWAGCAVLVGTDSQKITEHIERLMNGLQEVPKVQKLYGDGHAAEYIAQIIVQQLPALVMKQKEKHIPLA